MRIKFFYLLLLCLSPVSSFSQSTASKNVSTFTLEAPQLDSTKKIWVYLPVSYHSSSRKYPVIYMHDAQNLFDHQTSFVGEWEIDESLDSIKEPQAIIVGIEHGGNKRIDELTPFAHEDHGGGKADMYLDFLVHTLKPYIDENYRSIPGFDTTGIFGSSLGGLVSFYAAFKHPNTFGMVGTFSPSFWFNRQIYAYVKAAPLNKDTRFVFLAGTEESEEMIPDIKEMLGLLQDRVEPGNLKVSYIKGGKHNEAMWKKNFPESYLWLLTQKSPDQ